jgi:hypothetical protein
MVANITIIDINPTGFANNKLSQSSIINLIHYSSNVGGQ